MPGPTQQAGGNFIHADDSALLDGADHRPDDQGKVDGKLAKDDEGSSPHNSWVTCEGTRHKQADQR